MAMLLKMIISWWLFIASLFPFDFITSNIMTEQKGKECRGIRVMETFEYENTRNDFKCCNYREKWKLICQTTAKYTIPGTQGAFSDKVIPDIDDFIDEPEAQCNVQVVKKTSVNDSK